MDTAVLKTYVHIVDEGSFAAAARRLGISRSLSSKYISDLEHSLGARLLARSTRSVKPTELGWEYYTRVKAVLADLEAANDAVRSLAGQVSGKLRIGAPTSYMLKVLNPHVMGFIETYPEVQLDLALDDGSLDFAAEGYDATIRVGELEDSAMIAKRLHMAKAMTVAAPSYLEKYGRPSHPSDLAAHRILHYSNMRGAETWPFRRGQESFHQKIHPVFSANNGEMIRAAALEGKGIAMAVDFLVDEDLKAGRLEQVLPDFTAQEFPVNLVYPSARNMTAALRAFLDHIGREKFGMRERQAAA